ncbi:MAG: RsmD family RNA methyltransferase [Bacteroidota bacterium]
MRIVGGTFGGRRFSPPAKIPARPTTEVAREGLFNMLNNMMDLEGVKACELFAGTGSISYELASRGAADVTLVERDTISIDFIKKTAKELGIADMMHIIKADVFKFMKQSTGQYDLIFADPPYELANMDELPQLVFEKGMLTEGGTFVLEHTTRNDYKQHPRFLRMKNYGTTIFTFFTQSTD